MKSRGVLFRGVSWAMFDQILQFIAQIINIVVLTKLLGPHDIGIFAIVMVVISLVQQAFLLGFGSALIQEDYNDSYYHTAWTSNLIVSLFLTVILILLMPLVVQSFFPEYVQYLFYFKLMSLMILVNGTKNIGVVELYKSHKVKSLVILGGLNKIFVVAICILLYFKFGDFRALIYGYLINAIITVIITYLIAPIKIGISFNIFNFKQIYSFGVWIQLKGITSSIANQLDSLIIGSLMNPSSLGYYNRSILISKSQEVIITNLNNLIIYPYLAKVKGNKKLLQKLVEISYNLILIVASSGLLIFMIHGEVITEFILGDKWLSIVNPLKILLISSIFSLLALSMVPFLRALGFPKNEFKYYLVKIISLILLLYFLILKYGLVGGAVANLLANVISFPVLLYYLSRKITISIKKIISTLIVTLISSLIIIFVFSSINHTLILLEIPLMLLVYYTLFFLGSKFIVRNSFFISFIIDKAKNIL